MLVGTHYRAVHHCDKAFRFLAARDRGQHVVPGTVLGPHGEPSPQARPRPELGRHVPPRRPSPQPPTDPFHGQPMIVPRPPTPGARPRHQRLDPGPHLITELSTPGHDKQPEAISRQGYATRPRRPASQGQETTNGTRVSYMTLPSFMDK